jgi:uncharacterized protein YlxW (UPF0749 family)
VDVAEGVGNAKSGRVWNVSVQTADEAREESRRQKQEKKKNRKAEQHAAKVAQYRKRIADDLQRLPGRADTKSKVIQRLGKCAALVEAFDAMVGDGVLMPTHITKSNGHKYEAYGLTIAA